MKSSNGGMLSGGGAVGGMNNGQFANQGGLMSPKSASKAGIGTQGVINAWGAEPNTNSKGLAQGG